MGGCINWSNTILGSMEYFLESSICPIHLPDYRGHIQILEVGFSHSEFSPYSLEGIPTVSCFSFNCVKGEINFLTFKITQICNFFYPSWQSQELNFILYECFCTKQKVTLIKNSLLYYIGTPLTLFNKT